MWYLQQEAGSQDHIFDLQVNDYSDVAPTLKWNGIADAVINGIVNDVSGIDDIADMTFSNVEAYVSGSGNVWQGANVGIKYMAYSPSNASLTLESLPAGTYNVLWYDATDGDSCEDSQSPITGTGADLAVGTCSCCGDDAILLVFSVAPQGGTTTTNTEAPTTTTTTTSTTSTTVGTDCDAGSVPTCAGDCPEGEVCVAVAGSCECQVAPDEDGYWECEGCQWRGGGVP